jgi:hypothetical protein
MARTEWGQPPAQRADPGCSPLGGGSQVQTATATYPGTELAMRQRPRENDECTLDHDVRVGRDDSSSEHSEGTSS